MSFFDSKEEVLYVELTAFGKYSLSKGKFNPKYYAFFDEDILYDRRYANISESQNYAQQRILNETAYIKQNANYNSANERLGERYGDISSYTPEVTDVPSSLGTSDKNSEYLPAWDIQILDEMGSINEVKSLDIDRNNPEALNSIFSYVKIPQLNFKDNEFKFKSTLDIENYVFLNNEKLYGQIQQVNGELYSIISNEENLDILLEIREDNVVGLKENFEIEVFKSVKDSWEQLVFNKQQTNIQNDILLDDYIYKEEESNIDDKNVAYYLEISVDDEIQLEEIKKRTIDYGIIKEIPEVC